MKTEVRNEFILEAHKNACSEWKSKIEKECPELFENKLEVGKWYKYKGFENFLTFVKEDETRFGFDVLGKWFDYAEKVNKISGYILATEEEVKEILIKEAKKRGFKEGVTIKNHQGTFVLDKLDIVFSNKYNDGIYTRQDFGVWLCMNGVWAEIISNPIEEKINDLQKQLDELKKQL